MDVREKTKEEVEYRLSEITNDLTKINYLESIISGTSFGFELKRFVWAKLVEAYESRGMFDKAAKALSNKASIDVTFKEKIEDYLGAAEIYATKLGKIEDSEEMFKRALRESNSEQRKVIFLTRKNIYFATATNLKKDGKIAAAGKFYEKLLKMNLEDIEKQEAKEGLIKIYRSLGKFREIELLKGI